MNFRTATEAELRAYNVPFPKSLWQLAKICWPLIRREHGYGTCVYAMSICAVATMYYISARLGCTGFQASCADMDIIRRTRGIQRFRLLSYDDLLYPQYRYKFDECHWETLLKEQKDWLKDAANQNLMEHGDAHPEVLRHWERLAQS